MFCEICRDKKAAFAIALVDEDDEFIACEECAGPYLRGNWLISDLLVGDELLDYSNEEL